MENVITEDAYVPKVDPSALTGKRADTGRTFIVFDRDVTEQQMRQLVLSFGGSNLGARSSFLPEIGAAFVALDYDEIAYACEGGAGGVVAVERERVYRLSKSENQPWELPAAKSARTPLEAMNVRPVTIKTTDVKIAILDTGMQPDHPDFEHRSIRRRRFVLDEPEHDTDGHGTHCTGLAAGPASPVGGIPRYGVASEAGLIIAKVINSYNCMFDEALCAALNWAANRGATVINMSLGEPPTAGQTHSKALEVVAKRILEERQVLIIAGAGNASDGVATPVFHPANCPSIVAVAGLTSAFGPWSASSVQIEPDGEMNVAAPGERLVSSYPDKDGYARKSGTSMAAAYATGVAALWAATDADFRGTRLRDKLFASAIGVEEGTCKTVGWGMVQAP
jgi:subtilisin family serine protease